MDPQGNIYRTDKARRNSSDKEAARASLREDEARLDGYLKARAEADRAKAKREALAHEARAT